MLYVYSQVNHYSIENFKKGLRDQCGRKECVTNWDNFTKAEKTQRYGCYKLNLYNQYQASYKARYMQAIFDIKAQK